MTQFKSCPIRPFGKSRPRVTQHGTFMPPAYTSQKNALKMMFGPVDKYENIVLSVTAFRAMPKSWSQAKRRRMDGEYCTTKPDLDNIIGAVMDALLPDDDSHVVKLDNCMKIWEIDDALEIRIGEA